MLKSLKLVTLSYLQGENQVYVFHLLVEVGFLPFYEHRFFELHLVLSSCRVKDQEAVRVQDVQQESELCRCLKTFEDLSESRCSRPRVEKCRLVLI